MSNAQKSAVSRCLANVEPEPIDWLWWQRFARGKTNIIAGQPGQEKSQLTIFMAATVTRGGSWPDGEKCPTGNVLIISCEDDAADNDAPGEAAAQDAARRWIAEGRRVSIARPPPIFNDVNDVLMARFGREGGAA